MNRFLGRIFVFSVYILIIFFLFDFIISELNYDKDRYSWQFQELYNPKVNADIVIFGSSKSVRGLNTHVLEEGNTKIYNFSLNGSNPEYTYKWYIDFFRKKYIKPKLVILEVSWLMFNENWMWRRIEQDSKYFTSKDYFSMLLKSADKTSLFFNRYYLFKKDFTKSFLKSHENDKIGENLSLSYNGFTPFLGTISTKEYLDSITFNPDKQREYFSLLLDNLINDGVKVIMINLPENLDDEFSNFEVVKSNIAYLQKISKERNIDFFDYLKEPLPDTLFYNWNHLNIKGSELISNKLKNEIKPLLPTMYKKH